MIKNEVKKQLAKEKSLKGEGVFKKMVKAETPWHKYALIAELTQGDTRGRFESAGINRHREGDERAPRERNS